MFCPVVVHREFWVLDKSTYEFLSLIFITEFIQGVSQFSVKGDKESKLRFAFRIYDMDNDGYISNGELFQVVRSS